MADNNEKTEIPQIQDLQTTDEYPDFDLLGSNRGRFTKQEKTEENLPSRPKRDDGGDFL